MRKIESQMNKAISRRASWRSANTRVDYSPIRDASEVYLHNNLIAIVAREGIQLFDGGWKSKTTKSRLNAILNTFTMASGRVFAKKFEWFVNTSEGVKEFENGMIVA